MWKTYLNQKIEILSTVLKLVCYIYIVKKCYSTSLIALINPSFKGATIILIRIVTDSFPFNFDVLSL